MGVPPDTGTHRKQQGRDANAPLPCFPTSSPVSSLFLFPRPRGKIEMGVLLSLAASVNAGLDLTHYRRISIAPPLPVI